MALYRKNVERHLHLWINFNKKNQLINMTNSPSSFHRNIATPKILVHAVFYTLLLIHTRVKRRILFPD
jgi:hypothetical protein